MKKLLFALLGLALITSPAFAIDDPNYRNVNKLNIDGNVQGEALRLIKLVRYVSRDSDGFSLVSGDAVVYSLVSDDGVSVAQTNTSGDVTFAGIVCTTIQTADGGAASAFDDAGRRNWGWVVVNGYAMANVRAGGSNGHAAGNPFYTSRDGGAITAFQAFDLSHDFAAAAYSTYVNDQIIRSGTGVGGFFLDAATASDTTVEVYVETT